MPHAVPLIKGEKLYRIGVNADCPVHQIYAGGQCFPRYSEKVTGYGSETQRDRIKGAVVRMAEGGLEECLLNARYKVIRSTRGRKSRSRVYDIRSRNYRKMDGDRPVLDFMYAIELKTIENPYAGTNYPTLAETMGERTEEIVKAHENSEKEAADHVDLSDKPTSFAKEMPAKKRSRGRPPKSGV